MKIVGHKKEIIVLFHSLSGVHPEKVSPETTREEVESRFKEYVDRKVEEYRKSFSMDTFDIDTYEVNEVGGMAQIDRKSYNMNSYDIARKELLEDRDFQPI